MKKEMQMKAGYLGGAWFSMGMTVMPSGVLTYFCGGGINRPVRMPEPHEYL